MAISHKYRSFQELLEVVTVDFATYALEGMIEPQQLIKVAQRVNYDLGFRIHRDLETIIEVENNIGIFPADFARLNYAFVCSVYNIVTEIPSGTQSGKQFRLKGKGMPYMRGSGIGDLYVQVNTEVPISLNKEQKELLEKFRVIENEKSNPSIKKFFQKAKSFWNR